MQEEMTDYQTSKSTKTPKGSKAKTIIGIIVLIAIIAVLVWKFLGIFQNTGNSSYNKLISDYYTALSKNDTNELKTLKTVDFKDNQSAVIWLNNKPVIYVFSVQDLHPTNTIMATKKMTYCLINSRYKTAYLNEAYFLKKDNHLLLSYINNLYVGNELK